MSTMCAHISELGDDGGHPGDAAGAAGGAEGEQEGELRLQLQQGMQIKDREYQQDRDSKYNLNLVNLPQCLQGIHHVLMTFKMIQLSPLLEK